jgi:cytochrome c oxidase subunit IV
MGPMTQPRSYVLVFLALLALTAATVGLAYVNLGAWHAAVGLSIAGAKALLIVLFFMHVLRSKSLIWVIALSGLFWLGGCDLANAQKSGDFHGEEPVRPAGLLLRKKGTFPSNGVTLQPHYKERMPYAVLYLSAGGFDKLSCWPSGLGMPASA